MNLIRLSLYSIVLLLGTLFTFDVNAQTTVEEPVVPNVFTPNNDGVNDVFKIENLSGSWELMIFDRWGSLIYATQQAQGASWNGVNLQGIEADTGVYFFTLKDSKSGQSFNGSLQLLR